MGPLSMTAPDLTCASDVGGCPCGLPVYPCPVGPLPGTLGQMPLSACDGWLHLGHFHHCLWPAPGYLNGPVARPETSTVGEN